MTVAARKPLTSGERTCCEASSGAQRPNCMTVASGNTMALTSHGKKPMPATTSGALTVRRRTAVDAGLVGVAAEVADDRPQVESRRPASRSG